MRILFILALAPLFIQCQWKTESKPSVLIIAIESLGFEDFNCDSVENENIQKLCEDSINFTHAYTSSVMSVPALGSILTGLYPFESKLRNNGGYLGEEVKTVAEWALKNNYRTSFFSGGSPVLSRSGLNQGFEIFDMPQFNEHKNFYRPAEQTLNLLNQWLDRLSKEESFVATVYLPDLLYPEIPTSNNEGEERSISYTSQVQEIAESIGSLIKKLEKNKRWDNTNVFFLGLNGRSLRVEQLDSWTLHSENTRVNLLIKPAHKKRDDRLSWKIDENISFVDLGKTLFNILGSSGELKHSLFKKESLYPFNKKKLSLTKDRPILIESSWFNWHGIEHIHSSIIKGNQLLMYKEPLEFYNTLVDRLEVQAYKEESPEKDIFVQNFTKELSFLNQNYKRWSTENLIFNEKVKIGKNFLSSDKMKIEWAKERLYHLSTIAEHQDTELLLWQAQLALSLKDWSWLKELGELTKNSYWETVSLMHLGEPLPEVITGCAALLKVKSTAKSYSVNQCYNDLLVRLVGYYAEAEESKKKVKKKLFNDLYQYRTMEFHSIVHNQKKGLIFSNKYNFDKELFDVELYLSLHKKLRRKFKTN